MTYEFEGKNEKEAIEKAASELGLEKDEFDVEILESQKKTLFHTGYVKIRVHTDDLQGKPEVNNEKYDTSYYNTESTTLANPLPQDEFETKLLDFIKNVVEKMGYDVTVEVMFREENKLGVRLTSSSSSILIGRKGKNLDALQFLANIYAGRLGNDRIRIILDTENYRVRREESLVRLAYQTADKVRSSKMSILLDPMNPFERRLVHTTINDIPDVDTKSEGDGLFKQVRVFYNGML